MIDAPALVANHLFDLASVWNVVRDLFALSTQRVASCSPRLAATFGHGDFAFLTSKVYIFTCMCDQRLGPFDIIEKADAK